MKLLFAHEHLGALGGAEANLLLTGSHLRRRGHDLGLVYQQSQASPAPAWQECFPDRFQLAASGAAEPLAAWVAAWAPDVIYCHNLGDQQAFEVLLRSRVPVVRMVHDHQMYCLRGYKYNCFTRRICTRPASFYCVFPCLAALARNRTGTGLPLRWASYGAKRQEIRLNQQCARLVVFSDYMKQELVGNGFDPRRVAVHLPILDEDEPPADDGLSDRNLILYAGQIIRGKGVDLLLQALARIRTGFECRILGEGNHRSYCERLCRQLGLAGRVQFLGRVSREEIRRHGLEASVMAVSSVWPEPFGLVGPEAMRLGLPVVAFDAGAIREWLQDGHNGFLVPWGDTAAFAGRLEELLNDRSLARRLGANGRVEARARYVAERQVDALERLFQEVWNVSQPAPDERMLTIGNQ